MNSSTGQGIRRNKQGLIARALFYVSLCTVTLLTNACATTTGHVDLAYTPQSAASQLAGASQVHVRVDVTDKRASTDVGHKINGYGIEMAPIVADKNVTNVVKEAIETELRNRGFTTGDGSAVVLAELSSFKNTFQIGFFSGTAAADLAMNVMVIGADGKVLFKKWIMAKGVNPSIQMASATNAQVALEAALQDAMTKLFSEQDFLNALVSVGRSRAAG